MTLRYGLLIIENRLNKLTLCYYHVMNKFQSESTLYSLPECQGTPSLKQVHTWSLSDSIGSHWPVWLNGWVLVSSFAEWLIVCLQTKWLQVRISMLSVKLQIWCLLGARRSLTFRQTIKYGFTPELVCDMIIT